MEDTMKPAHEPDFENNTDEVRGGRSTFLEGVPENTRQAIINLIYLYKIGYFH